MRGLSLLLSAAIWLVMTTASPAASASSVLLLGDSNIRGALGIVLERDLEAMGHDVTRYGVPSSGLARPDFFDWSLTAKGLAEMVRPDLVLVMFGANDTQRIKTPGGATIHWRDQAAWHEAYRARWKALVMALRGPDRHVVVLGPTNRRSPRHVLALQRVIAVQRQVAASLSGVVWLDLFPHSTDARGEHLHEGFDVFGRRVRFRMSDGRHLTRRGGVEVARRLLVSFDQMGILSGQVPAN
ncbi:MAG: DUF459 domain-containing protein [Myxococcota bacterium]|nr:DUF459 domain-containing protein [Myxococcota bacterium]